MELLLNKDELLDLGEDTSGTRIACAAGQCWITQSGDSRDHFVKAGEVFNVTNNGQLVIVAINPARLKLYNARESKKDCLYNLIKDFSRSSLFTKT